jgi:hypothetical protein
MYIDVVPNRDSRPAVLLREGWREGKRVRKRTIANLTDWPKAQVEALRLLLKGVRMVPADEAVTIVRSRPHGHVEAVLGAIGRLGVDGIVASKRSRQRDLVVAMIAQRLISPRSKLATTRLWRATSLAEQLGVEDAQVDELYEALDWLLARQGRIEKKLARRHLREGGQALYDVSSSYYEGRTCPLARHGYGRDGKKGKTIIVYGVMTDAEGRPVGVDVYPGNTGDPTTVVDQSDKLRQRFGLERIVLVGDRGMLTSARIEELKKHPGLGWISALRSSAIRGLVDQGAIQLSLFDEQNLAEITSPDYPGERLVVCFNPLLADERRRKREELLEATQRELAKIERAVARRTRAPMSEGQIALKTGKVVNRFKMAKHFGLTIGDGRFAFERDGETIAREAALDGLYVIRTSESRDDLTADDTVRSYKNLSHVERAFRTLKGPDLRVRPIHHRTEDHVRAHIFLCLLAYYVEWHMRRAWAPLLFDDERLAQDRGTRDPVAPAQPSASARRKKATRKNAEGFEVHSFETLLADLATRCTVRCRLGPAPCEPAGKRPARDSPTVTFDRVTEPTDLQSRAFDLLGMLPVEGKRK